ncbi:hypothetical protein ACFZCU_22465 [Streptomyces canus]|uniref:hypothetical protein n=1 Tax=Streptomyces canus TaxID=58343 RepID=UPI0036F14999
MHGHHRSGPLTAVAGLMRIAVTQQAPPDAQTPPHPSRSTGNRQHGGPLTAAAVLVRIAITQQAPPGARTPPRRNRQHGAPHVPGVPQTRAGGYSAAVAPGADAGHVVVIGHTYGSARSLPLP